MQQAHGGFRLLAMENIPTQLYIVFTEYGGGAASFPACMSRKGAYGPCVSQT
jgi:hypothetical protein